MAGGGGYGASRFDNASFQSSYQTPGWQRAQNNQTAGGHAGAGYAGKAGQKSGPIHGGNAGGGAARQKWPDKSRGQKFIEGQVIASSTRDVSEFKVKDRVFHEKFGYGEVAAVDGNKLTVVFEKAGEKKVVDSFVDKV